MWCLTGMMLLLFLLSPLTWGISSSGQKPGKEMRIRSILFMHPVPRPFALQVHLYLLISFACSYRYPPLSPSRI